MCDWCSYGVTFVEVKKKKTFEVIRKEESDASIQYRRFGRESLSLSFCFFSLCHTCCCLLSSLKRKRHSSFFSAVPYSQWELRLSSGSICPSLPSFPSRQTEKQTFFWLFYVIKYTVKWIIYISRFDAVPGNSVHMHTGPQHSQRISLFIFFFTLK